MLISRAKPWICITVSVFWLLLSFASSRTAAPPELSIPSAIGSFASMFAFLVLAVVFTASTVRLSESGADELSLDSQTAMVRVRRVFTADFLRRDGAVAPTGKALRAGLVAGLMMTLAVLLLSSGVSYLLREMGYAAAQQEIADVFIAGGVGLRCVLFAILVVFTPFVEELFFRYATAYTLEGTLRNRRLAEVLTAILFALMHANVAAFLPLVVVSLCCSAVYRRTGNFLSPVVAHSFFNLVSIVVLLLP